jgi:peptidyl-prolyl cis-trans isomerase C
MRRFVLLCLPLCAATLTGCGDRPTVIAEVGERKITVQDFTDVVAGNELSYPAAPDSAKRLALLDLMRRELLMHEAIKRGLDKDSLAVRYRAAVEERSLVEALYRREAPSDVPVSDGEISEFYSWRDSAAHTRLIYTTDREAADAALAALRAGEDFGAVATRYNISGTMPPGGDLGFRLPGDLVDPLDTQLRTGAVGELLGPFQAPTEGWFVMRIEERRANPQPPLDQARGDLEIMLRQRKQRALATKTYLSLKERYAIAGEEGGPQAMFMFYNDAVRRDAEGLPQQEPTAEMRAETLGRYRDAAGKALTYTFGDALADMADARRQRPDVSLVPAIQRWIENQIVRRAAYMEAKRQHLEQEPEIARKIDRDAGTYLVDGIFSSEIASQVSVDEADLRAAYALRADVLQKPFEALNPAEMNAIANDAASMESERLFIAFTDSLAKTVKPYKVHEERLAKVAWPLPQPEGTPAR